MNENYNKHRRNIIVVLTIITAILVACSYNSRKDNNTKKEIATSEQEIINNQNEIEAKSKETDELLKFLQILILFQVVQEIKNTLKD